MGSVLKQAQGADLGRGAEVGAAAGVEVEIFDLDQPNRALETGRKASRSNSEAFKVGDLGGSPGDGSCGTNLERTGLLELLEVIGAQLWQIELDIAGLRTEVECGGRPPEVPQGNRRQKVLGRVLLHVVPPPLPIEDEARGPARNSLFDKMTDRVADLLNIHHADT